ncbi:MAG: ABC transporter ATP-binding protein [Rhodocyclales bacterium]|nr:ABC transporter ATP-binding protein [Rhodocyclales bacterium]
MLAKVFHILEADQKRSALVLLVLMLVGMLLETLGVGLVVPAIALMIQDDFATGHPLFLTVVGHLGNPSQRTLVLGAVAFLVCVYVFKNAFLALLAWRQARFAFNAQARVSHRLFELYLWSPYIFHVENNSAQLIRNVTTEASLFASYALLPGMLLIAEAFVLLGIGILLFAVEPVGAVAVTLVIGSTAWAFHRITRTWVTRWGKLRQFHEGLRIQQIQQGLGGVKDVKVFGREADFLARFARHNSENAKVAERQSSLQQMPRLWLEVLAVTGLAVLVFSMIGQQRELLDIIPTLGLFAAAAFRLMPSMNRVLTSLQALRYGGPIVDLLYLELRRPTEAAAVVPGQASLVFGREVRFCNVSYRYPGATSAALDELSLAVAEGETVGIVGTSGSGKSTLVDVMLGLLEPVRGRVEVDGVDIRGDLRAWRKLIGYVPQTIYLTDDTLRRNVAFGIPDNEIDEAAVARALSFAQLDDFVLTLPEGLDSCVGERGVRLSGGQRQRIGIARALYHNPPILVLDEASSALDVVTEREVMNSIAALHGRKTIVIVAHRLSTVEHCDRICRLEHGRIVQEGAPAMLLSQLMTAVAIPSHGTE